MKKKRSNDHIKTKAKQGKFGNPFKGFLNAEDLAFSGSWQT